MEATALTTTGEHGERQELALRPMQSIFLDPQRFEFAQRIGKMLATATMVPDHFRNNLGNCLIAINLSERLNVDTFMLMQTLYVVHGKPGIESKLGTALFNERTKLFTPPLRYEKEGDYPHGKDARCRAYAKDKASGEIVYGEWIDWPMVEAEGWASKNGSKWKTMPGQMFVYRAAMFFIRQYEAGVLLGLQTREELEDMIIDVTPTRSLKVDEDTGEVKEGEDIYATTEPPVAAQEKEPEVKADIFFCDYPGCTFESETERGLKKHKTQQRHWSGHAPEPPNEPEEGTEEAEATEPRTLSQISLSIDKMMNEIGAGEAQPIYRQALKDNDLEALAPGTPIEKALAIERAVQAALDAKLEQGE